MSPPSSPEPSEQPKSDVIESMKVIGLLYLFVLTVGLSASTVYLADDWVWGDASFLQCLLAVVASVCATLCLYASGKRFLDET